MTEKKLIKTAMSILGKRSRINCSLEEKKRLASEAGKARWKNTTPEQRKLHSLKMLEARNK